MFVLLSTIKQEDAGNAEREKIMLYPVPVWQVVCACKVIDVYIPTSLPSPSPTASHVQKAGKLQTNRVNKADKSLPEKEKQPYLVITEMYYDYEGRGRLKILSILPWLSCQLCISLLHFCFFSGRVWAASLCGVWWDPRPVQQRPGCERLTGGGESNHAGFPDHAQVLSPQSPPPGKRAERHHFPAASLRCPYSGVLHTARVSRY